MRHGRRALCLILAACCVVRYAARPIPMGPGSAAANAGALDGLGGRALRRPPPVIAPENPVSCGRLFRGRDFVAAALRVDSLAVKAACDT